jgi:hypothetical protein
MEESSIVTWMNSNINIVTDTAMKAKYITALEAAKRTRCSSQCASTM